MFFHDNLIIGYVQDPENGRYLIQITGGEEILVSEEVFFAHWQEYRVYEAGRAQQDGVHYRPLPVTHTIKRDITLCPANTSLRRKRRSAYFRQPMLAHG
jgi:hypothetical protein